MTKIAAHALILVCLGLAPVVLATPAAAGASDFSIVNRTGAALRDLALRRVGDAKWQPLSVAPAAGASVRVAFKSPDCAFDLRATVVGVGQTVWNGVNLCDVKSVTLHRDSSGRKWVDYD